MGIHVLILGITGNIASGKSLVVELLSRKGAAVLSADLLARELVAPGSPVLDQLVDLFGVEILAGDGELDREALGGLVFADDKARQRLNRLMHPAIAALSEGRLASLVAGEAPLVVYEAPLLFEVGAEKRVDRVLVVTVELELQLQRLLKRDGLDEIAARRRIDAQMPQQEKVMRADYLIDNSGSLSDLEAEVDMLWLELVG